MFAAICVFKFVSNSNCVDQFALNVVDSMFWLKKRNCWNAKVVDVELLPFYITNSICDFPKFRGSLITHQPTESLWISYNSMSHYCAPFIGIHIIKIG